MRTQLLCYLLLAPPLATQDWTPLGSPVWHYEFPNVVTDFARGRLLTIDQVGTTWEWDGAIWREMGPGLTNSSYVFDASRQRILMVSFQSTSLYREWNGHEWLALPITTVLPSAKPMAYDTARNRVLMVDHLNVLHEWDGVTWTAFGQTPAVAWPVLVYDSTRQEMLLLSHGNINTSMTTHSWNGTTWQLRANTGPTNPLFGCADDPARGRIVAHGGGTSIGPGSQATWEWDGTQWTMMQANGPIARRNHTLAFDPVLGKVIAFSGVGNTSLSMTDAWSWNGATWQRISVPAPATRALSATAFDQSSNRMLVYGGRIESVVRGEHWEFDGLRWSQRTLASSPGVREGHAMASDLSGGVLLFGGANGQFVGDTWRWSGSAWTAVANTGPSPRASHGMALDPARGRVMLHGGSAGIFSFLSDTWEWDGTQWTLVGTNGPTSLLGPILMTYDPVTGGALLHASFGQAGTSLWNGTTWAPIAGLLPDAALALAFDPTRGTTIGVTRAGISGQLDTWQLSSGAWIAVAGSRPVGGRFDGVSPAGLVSDNQSRMLLFTGTSLWSSSATPATASDVGAACSDPAVTTPFLKGFGLPRLGDLDYQLDIHAAGQRAGVVGFSPRAATLSFGPGCDWQIDLGPRIVVITNASGTSRLPLGLPRSARFYGLELRAQLATIEPLAVRGFTFSAPLRLQLGH